MPNQERVRPLIEEIQEADEQQTSDSEGVDQAPMRLEEPSQEHNKAAEKERLLVDLRDQLLTRYAQKR